MNTFAGKERPHRPDWEAFVAAVARRGTPQRVHHIELYQDGEIRDAIADRYGLANGLDKADPYFAQKRYIAVQRFCGFDYVVAGLTGLDMPLNQTAIPDTAGLKRDGGRNFVNEHTGPITTWEEFEKYPWPDPNTPEATCLLEWYERNLPDDMCIIGGLTGHFAELLTWLMGYETLCYALHDDKALVKAIADRLHEFYEADVRRLLQFERVKMVWGSDDMGFKTGLLLSPAVMREYVLTGHRKLAQMVHGAGKLYLLHACGNLSSIMDDLIFDVKIDAKHSFEDTIEDVRQVKHMYGRHIALLGGIDLDFLCSASEERIRERVRETLAVCQAGGGYCLGTGNSVANYIPLDNYLAMVDEGMRWSW
ncbi:MAG TPA: uroporphyrinogen decarboxylase family protein [Candidatus Latescibacteria bacterium]|nr:uroporphyrinogen decarboxylase family protein [Candidatus Latescibacterota bacterium]